MEERPLLLPAETTSDTTEEVSTPPLSEPNEDVAEHPIEEATPSAINNISRRIQPANRIRNISR